VTCRALRQAAGAAAGSALSLQHCERTRRLGAALRWAVRAHHAALYEAPLAAGAAAWPGAALPQGSGGRT
jgi:hypothetical protein